MRIAIFGAGGAAAYFGGRLAQAGEEVIFIARGKHLEAIREHGLQVESVKGDFTIRDARATDDPKEVGPVDAVILGVKAWQVTEAAQAMQAMMGPETFVLPVQNGVETVDRLSAVLGAEHVLGGVAKIFSLIAGPGKIHHPGGPGFLAFGELDNRRSARIEKLKETLDRAGILTDIPADIHVAMWEKFLLVTPFSGIGAVTRAPIGVLRSLPETKSLLNRGIREIFDVARALKIDLAGDVPAKTMQFIESLQPGLTASMQRDIMEGRPSELENLVGAVVRLGEKTNVPTPLHSFLHASLLPLELKARGRMEFPA